MSIFGDMFSMTWSYVKLALLAAAIAAVSGYVIYTQSTIVMLRSELRQVQEEFTNCEQERLHASRESEFRGKALEKTQEYYEQREPWSIRDDPVTQEELEKLKRPLKR